MAEKKCCVQTTILFVILCQRVLCRNIDTPSVQEPDIQFKYREKEYRIAQEEFTFAKKGLCSSLLTESIIDHP